MPTATRPARLGLLGDIHCEDVALAAAIACLRDAGAEVLLAVGDIVDGRGDANRCVALLAEHGAWVVRGNHDRWLLGKETPELPYVTPPASLSPVTLEYLATLPATRTFTVAGEHELVLCHGLGDNDQVALEPDTPLWDYEIRRAFYRVTLRAPPRYHVGGHTHRRMVRAVDGVTFLNPGTLVRDDDPGFALLDLAAGAVQFFDVTAESAVQVAERVELPSGPP